MLSSKILSYLLVFIIANLLRISLMADFQGIFCRPFLPSVLIIEGWVGGMASEWVGWAVGWSGMGGGVGWDGEG